MKQCLECKETKELSEYRTNTYNNVSSDYCKSCVKDYWKWQLVFKKYNLSKEDVQAMYLEQLGKCWICQISFLFSEIQIDHCHKSGKVRGLLCKHCNWLLGHAKDNPNTLARAIEYLS